MALSTAEIDQIAEELLEDCRFLKLLINALITGARGRQGIEPLAPLGKRLKSHLSASGSGGAGSPRVVPPFRS